MLYILQALGYAVTPLTANSWLELYLQLYYQKKNFGFITNRNVANKLFPDQIFLQASKVGDNLLLQQKKTVPSLSWNRSIKNIVRDFCNALISKLTPLTTKYLFV